MKITLCGSATFEDEFKRLNKKLTLAGHTVYSLAVYPSDESGKDWYTKEQKVILDQVHCDKIKNSDAIYVISKAGELGESTAREVQYAESIGNMIMSPWSKGYFTHKVPDSSIKYGIVENEQLQPIRYVITCPFKKCYDPISIGPCDLCQE